MKQKENKCNGCCFNKNNVCCFMADADVSGCVKEQD